MPTYAQLSALGTKISAELAPLLVIVIPLIMQLTDVFKQRLTPPVQGDAESQRIYRADVQIIVLGLCLLAAVVLTGPTYGAIGILIATPILFLATTKLHDKMTKNHTYEQKHIPKEIRKQQQVQAQAVLPGEAPHVIRSVNHPEHEPTTAGQGVPFVEPSGNPPTQTTSQQPISQELP